MSTDTQRRTETSEVAGGELPMEKQKQMPKSEQPKEKWEIESALGSGLRQRLNETPAKALAPNLARVIYATSEDSVANVFARLIDNGILSVPLLDVEKNQYIAFIDILDILCYIVERGNLQSDPEALKYDWDQRMKMFEATRCTELLTHSKRRRPWITMSRDASVQQAINLMASTGAHRIALVDEKGNFASILSQHRIIKWLSNRNFSEFGELGGLSVDELSLGSKPVVCLDFNQRVVDAVMLMYEKGVSGVGILRDKKLVGNISLTDLKDIGHCAQMYTKLFMTCEKFCGMKREGAGLPPLIYSTPRANLKEVISKYSNYFIHRVYVVEKATHVPIGVITCTDIIKLFAQAK